MKRITLTIIGLIALLALVFASSVSGITWLTYREDVSFTGTVDFDNTTWYNGTLTTAPVTINITLPCNLSELTGGTTIINISASTISANISYNLTVNGDILNSSDALNTSNTHVARYYVHNLTDLRNAVNVSNTSAYLNYTFDCNNSASIITVRVVAADGALTGTWITSNVVTTEYDRTTPRIKTARSSSFFTVNDSINITNTMNTSGTFGITLTDINLTTQYPSHNISTPDTWIIAPSIVNGSYQVNYTTYQKRGPYTYNIDEDIDGTDHEVTIYISAEEVLTNCVDWSIDIDDSFYEGFLDTVDYASLEISLNNIDKTWSRGSIEMDDLTIRALHSLNRFVFTWTVPAAIAPAVAPAGILPGVPAWTDEVLFLPFWVWIVIVIAVIVTIVAVVIYYKKQ